MAVSIDTVYQRVLVLANKEQRGYVTPQEFNLLANQAQMEIFEQYFYDRNQTARIPGNSTEFSDVDTILDEKKNLFKIESLISNGVLPTNVYRLGAVSVVEDITNNIFIAAEEVTIKDFMVIQNAPLLKPTNDRPVFVRNTFSGGNRVLVYGNNTSNTSALSNGVNSILISYVRAPRKVDWGYVVINDKPLYNDNTSIDFELHRSDETELVYKILKLSGMSMKEMEMVKVGQSLEGSEVQQQKQ